MTVLSEIPSLSNYSLRVRIEHTKIVLILEVVEIVESDSNINKNTSLPTSSSWSVWGDNNNCTLRPRR